MNLCRTAFVHTLSIKLLSSLYDIRPVDAEWRRITANRFGEPQKPAHGRAAAPFPRCLGSEPPCVSKRVRTTPDNPRTGVRWLRFQIALARRATASACGKRQERFRGFRANGRQ